MDTHFIIPRHHVHQFSCLISETNGNFTKNYIYKTPISVKTEATKHRFFTMFVCFKAQYFFVDIKIRFTLKTLKLFLKDMSDNIRK